mmetsp:Transcript_121089/g.342610  ORF Transcript_121089/g.342610 Transcript_121089/m.342610 type:complete len:439 (-) Transcript_121089:28-1344(-)
MQLQGQYSGGATPTPDYQPQPKRSRVEGELVSEADILHLVAQRESMRQARRFAESDAIREQLRALGVELYDKEKEWRSRDGRRGTLFTAGPAECQLTDAEIQQRVHLREEARKMKDFGQADALRDELRMLGVELDDKSGSWSTATGRRGTYTGSGQTGVLSDGISIRKLVAERERFRSIQDFASADHVRQHLLQVGVEIYDNDRIWRSKSGLQGVIITGGHEVECRLSDEQIANSVAQREAARAAKNWGEADAIRDELRRHGVELLDNAKQWCTTDGRSASYAGGPALPHNQQAPAMTAIVGTSHEAMLAHNRDVLAALAGAPPAAAVPPPEVNPAMCTSREAMLAHNQAVLASLAGSLALQQQPVATTPQPAAATTSLTFSDASINAMIGGRERARERKDWDAADSIRADLRSHGIEVWDKEKVWRVSDGRSGTIAR